MKKAILIGIGSFIVLISFICAITGNVMGVIGTSGFGAVCYMAVSKAMDEKGIIGKDKYDNVCRYLQDMLDFEAGMKCLCSKKGGLYKDFRIVDSVVYVSYYVENSLRDFTLDSSKLKFGIIEYTTQLFKSIPKIEESKGEDLGISEIKFLKDCIKVKYENKSGIHKTRTYNVTDISLMLRL